MEWLYTFLVMMVCAMLAGVIWTMGIMASGTTNKNIRAVSIAVAFIAMVALLLNVYMAIRLFN